MFIKLPEELLKDTKLSSTDKILLGVILSYEGKICYASNSYLAERLGVYISTISKRLCKLDKLEYIHRESRPRKHGGSKRIITPLKYRMSNNGNGDSSNMPSNQVQIVEEPSPIMDTPYKNSRLIEYNKESSLPTIPESVFEEMKDLYPNKDIEKATKGFLAFNKGRTINIDFFLHKYHEWCERERPLINNNDSLSKLRAEYE